MRQRICNHRVLQRVLVAGVGGCFGDARSRPRWQQKRSFSTEAHGGSLNIDCKSLIALKSEDLRYPALRKAPSRITSTPSRITSTPSRITSTPSRITFALKKGNRCQISANSRIDALGMIQTVNPYFRDTDAFKLHVLLTAKQRDYLGVLLMCVASIISLFNRSTSS
jgi:hypothetical protein